MKKAILLFVFSLTALWLAAQAPDWLWAKKAGGTGIDEGYDIATDSSGNSYATGFFVGTASFGSTTLTSSGGADIFIAKLDTNGNWLWANQAGGTGGDYGNCIATDGDGNIYATGYFDGTATFGSTTITSGGYYDAFITKLDTNGNFLWAKQAGGTSTDYGRAIATDSSGNNYITGSFKGTANFGPTTLTSNGLDDIFIAKLDTSGNWLWTKKAGGASYDIGNGIATDSSGNSYVTGQFTGTANFDPTTLTSSGYYDIFIAKLDTNGNYLWAKQAGGTDNDEGWSIATDISGNCYLTGLFAGTAILGITTLTSSGYSDFFIAKLDTNGNWLWAKQAGGANLIHEGWSIATDSNGNCFVAGRFTGTATFGTTTLTSSGGSDILIGKYDANGNCLWVTQAGGTGWDFGNGITNDSNGNIYATGNIQGTTNFGNITLIGSGTFDIFIAKLSNSTGASDEYGVPQANFSLGQNHPNPFTASTSFYLEVSDAKSVYEVSVYDLRGRHICNLHHGVLPAGKRSFTWNGKDAADNELASGVYFYRVSNGISSQVKKMIYIR